MEVLSQGMETKQLQSVSFQKRVTSVRRAVDGTGTCVPVPLVFGALGAVELVRL